MESICSQAVQTTAIAVGCFIYDFQTLLTGVIAIIVAIVAGVPVWRQLRDSNLQTRISHRETLATLLRGALRRYEKVDQSIREPLAMADRVTSDPIGEPVEIDPHDAHHLEQMFRGALDWYLVVMADTEHGDIEARKSALKESLDRLVETLGEAHWADHNDQHDEDHSIPDDEWARIVARCAQAKFEASGQVSEVRKAFRLLGEAQQQWVQALRAQIAQLDRQITAPR